MDIFLTMGNNNKFYDYISHYDPIEIMRRNLKDIGIIIA